MFINAAMFTVFFYESKFENSFHLLFSSSISFNVFKILFLKLCPNLCLFLCGFMPTCGVLRGQTGVLDSLELGFQEVVSLLFLGTCLGSSAGVACILHHGAGAVWLWPLAVFHSFQCTSFRSEARLILRHFIQGKMLCGFSPLISFSACLLQYIEKWLAFLLVLYHVTLLKLFEI